MAGKTEQDGKNGSKSMAFTLFANSDGACITSCATAPARCTCMVPSKLVALIKDLHTNHTAIIRAELDPHAAQHNEAISFPVMIVVFQDFG